MATLECADVLLFTFTSSAVGHVRNDGQYSARTLFFGVIIFCFPPFVSGKRYSLVIFSCLPTEDNFLLPIWDICAVASLYLPT